MLGITKGGGSHKAYSLSELSIEIGKDGEESGNQGGVYECERGKRGFEEGGSRVDV